MHPSSYNLSRYGDELRVYHGGVNAPDNIDPRRGPKQLVRLPEE